MSTAETRAMVQTTVLTAAAGTCCAIAVFALPPSHRLMGVVGCVMFPLAWWLAPRFPTRPRAAELLGISVVALVPFLFLLTRDAPGTMVLSFCNACLGGLTVLGFWVVRRYPPASPSPESRGLQVLLGLGLGLGGALVLGLIALVLLTIAFVASPAERAAILHTAGQLYVGYLGLGLAFGLVLGLAMPIAHYPLARMMLGVLGGAAFFASAMPAARFVLVTRGDAPPSVGIGIVAVLVGGILLGPAVAFSLKEP